MRKSKKLTRKEIQLELEHLIHIIGSETVTCARMESLEDSLDFLRACVKYRMLDLEATTRELKAARNNI